MKNIKTYIFLIITIMLYACVVENGENPYYTPGEFGIYPDYVAGSNSVYNLLDPSNSKVDFKINASESGGDVAVSGELHAAINSEEFTKISDISSFPVNINLSLNEVVTVLSKNISSLTGGDIVRFKTFFTNSLGDTITSSSVFNAAIVCPPVSGTYTINMQDAYGDGWQGGGINFILDGDTTFITLDDPNASSGTATFEVTSGSTALVLEYVDDSYNEEVSFQIYDPNNQLINSSSNPSAGVLSVPSTCP
ncbi:hypothetical protein [Thalassobellus citreus]|uniref:hypothetical protein n=1 Tax=Thalassobellus citreus TaxID=3367752 RepID=UPI00379A9E7D